MLNWSWRELLMKSFTYAIILVTLAAVSPSVQAQSTSAGGAEQRSSALAGEVERAGGELRLVLTNPSDNRAVQGSASVSIGSSADAAIKLAITLAPGETRRFPLSKSITSGTSGPSSDQYSLTVYNQTGSLVLYKIAKIKLTAGVEKETVPKQASAPKKDSKDVSVNARLT